MVSQRQKSALYQKEAVERSEKVRGLLHCSSGCHGQLVTCQLSNMHKQAFPPLQPHCCGATTFTCAPCLPGCCYALHTEPVCLPHRGSVPGQQHVRGHEQHHTRPATQAGAAEGHPGQEGPVQGEGLVLQQRYINGLRPLAAAAGAWRVLLDPCHWHACLVMHIGWRSRTARAWLAFKAQWLLRHQKLHKYSAKATA